MKNLLAYNRFTLPTCLTSHSGDPRKVLSGYNNHIQLNGNSNCRRTEDLLDAGQSIVSCR